MSVRTVAQPLPVARSCNHEANMRKGVDGCHGQCALCLWIKSGVDAETVQDAPVQECML